MTPGRIPHGIWGYKTSSGKLKVAGALGKVFMHLLNVDSLLTLL